MLEEKLPEASKLIRCFINGKYKYWPHKSFYIIDLRLFIELLKSSSIDKKNIIFNNLFSKLDGIRRVSEDELISDDEIPF